MTNLHSLCGSDFYFKCDLLVDFFGVSENTARKWVKGSLAMRESIDVQLNDIIIETRAIQAMIGQIGGTKEMWLRSMTWAGVPSPFDATAGIDEESGLAYLRDLFPFHRDQRDVLAEAMSVSVRTAQRWLAGKPAMSESLSLELLDKLEHMRVMRQVADDSRLPAKNWELAVITFVYDSEPVADEEFDSMPVSMAM